MPTPNYYVMFCRHAERMFHALYKDAQACGGTKIVCGNYKLPGLTDDHPIINVVNEKPPRLTPRQVKKNMAQVDPCDCTFNVGPWFKEAQPWHRGLPFMGRASGLMTTQFVCEQQPTEVWFAGFEGYVSHAGNKVTEYFDGISKGGPVAAKWTQQFYAPQLREIMIGCPDTKFVMVGRPTYKIEAPNLEIIQ